MDLNTVWFLVIGALFIGYAILDGFDLGVGVLHLFARNNHERRIHVNAIGPIWDGNEVWLITGGAALFAAFPVVYATVFSSFYIALMLVLVALIFRAVSFEFRTKVHSELWRRFWDWSFGLGSLVALVIFGVAVGNILRGLPIDERGFLAGSFLGLLNPYAILIGVLALVLMIMHGGVYMTLKTDGELRERIVRWVNGGWVATVVLYFIATLATFFVSPYLFESVLGNPLFWILLVIMLAALVYIPVAVKAGRFGRAFLSSSLLIAAMLGLAAVSIYPRLVPSSVNLDFSLTAYNASSTPRTLTAMLIIACIGLPLVIIYTIFIYRVFKGKTVISEESY